MSGLSNGTEYVFQLRAVNSVGEGRAASATGTPVRAPLPPGSGFLVGNFGQPGDDVAQIFVTQDIVGVFTTGARGAELHNIEFRLFSRLPDIAQLPSATLYRASVTDTRVSRGAEVAALTAVPGSPRPAATAQTVAFTAPGGTRLEAGATYLVVLEEFSYVRVESTTFPAEDAGGAPGWAIDGIGAGNSSPYSYQTTASLLMRVNGTTARAQRAVQEEAVATDSAQAQSAQSAQPLPGAPRNFTVSAEAYTRDISQSARATLSWAAPANQGEALLERYEYRYAEADKALPGRWRHAGASGLSETVKGLELRTGYVFELRAVNLEGPGPAVRGKVTKPAGALGIGLYAPGSSAIEGQALRIGARRPDPTDSETIVAVQVLDSAFEGARPVTLILQFAAGEATATGTMTVPFDGARPASRTLTATLTSVQRPYVLGSPKSLTFKVTDRDASVRVGDARVREGPQAALAFTVTLDRARDRDVTVEYATSDATARAGEDYTAVSGTLVFTAGERSGTVSVPVLDDALDEGAETLTLRLFNARGAVIEDGVAEGTILNSDLMPDAWLSRFGRAASDQVAQSIGRRLEGGARESHLTVMGWRVDALFDSRRAGRVSGEEPEHEAALDAPRFGRDGAELRRRTPGGRNPRGAGRVHGARCAGRSTRRGTRTGRRTRTGREGSGRSLGRYAAGAADEGWRGRGRSRARAAGHGHGQFLLLRALPGRRPAARHEPVDGLGRERLDPLQRRRGQAVPRWRGQYRHRRRGRRVGPLARGPGPVLQRGRGRLSTGFGKRRGGEQHAERDQPLRPLPSR